MSGVTYTSVLGPDGDDPYVVPVAINNSGVVVGNYSNTSSDSLGFIDNAGTYTVLNGPDGDDSYVSALVINNAGVVAGDYDTDGKTFTFIDNDGTYTSLTGPADGDNYIDVCGIDSSGEVIGSYSNTEDKQVGFIYDNGTYTSLSGGPDGDDTNITPCAISPSGTVTGYYETQARGFGVFTYSGGTFTALPTLTGAPGLVTPTAINDAGEIVGYYDTATDYAGFIYANGTYTTLISPDSDFPASDATGINSSGEITGDFTNGTGGGSIGFIYEGGTYTELDGPGSGNEYAYLSAINDSGTIAGFYEDSSGNEHGITASLCYLRGTRILTNAGMVVVEALRIGDAVVTRFGGIRKIKWIGQQSYESRLVEDHPERLPVCIHPGALGDDGPARKLFVSPGHSVLLGETLVLASALVNGITVTQRYDDETPAMIDYFQIELESHDCIIAEGVWAETYADAPGQRAQFHNEAEYYALYPDEPPPEELLLCAPRPERGAKLEAALRPVAARAAALVTPGRFEGYVETIADWRISGWAIDHDHPELPVLLEVMVGEAVIGTVLACEMRPDLAQAGIGNGRHAFVCVPRARLSPAAWPEITLRRARDGAALQMAAGCQDRIAEARGPALMMAAE